MNIPPGYFNPDQTKRWLCRADTCGEAFWSEAAKCPECGSVNVVPYSMRQRDLLHEARSYIRDFCPVGEATDLLARIDAALSEGETGRDVRKGPHQSWEKT